MKQSILLWGLERQHPRSTSIDYGTIGRTRKEVRKRIFAEYERCFPNEPGRGTKMAEQHFKNGNWKIVRVELSWGEP